MTEGIFAVTAKRLKIKLGSFVMVVDFVDENVRRITGKRGG